MTYKAPGKAHREGISLLELAEMFPDEEAARKWFEAIFWPNGERFCPNCGTDNNYECKHKEMPYRCRDCKRYFSVKTGTCMAKSPIPLRKWVYAVYLELTSLKGVSSMKLHRDLKISQSAAWFMLQRIRESFADDGPKVRFEGPVEVDETAIGGLERNKHESQREHRGRGTVGKTTVVGAKDRKTGQVSARVVKSRDSETLQGFVHEHTAEGAEVYTDDYSGYKGLPNHETVKHSVSEYVAGHVHTQGIESFWSMLKRAHKGVYHKVSPKHLQRYVNQFAGRHNIRELDTLEQMALVTEGLAGKRLTYKALVADNGLDSFAREVAA